MRTINDLKVGDKIECDFPQVGSSCRTVEIKEINRTAMSQSGVLVLVENESRDQVVLDPFWFPEVQAESLELARLRYSSLRQT